MSTFLVIYLPQESVYGQKEKFLADDQTSAILQARAKMEKVNARSFDLFEEKNQTLLSVFHG